MTAITLTGIVLTAVLSTFFTLGRNGANAVSYLAMDAQNGTALEYFARDVRMARAITWNSATSVTLTIPDNYVTTANQVTYAWDNTSGSATYRCFYRNTGNVTSANPRIVLARNVSTFSFARFDRLNASTSSDTATKRLELSMSSSSGAQAVPNATDQFSATFILRNKPVS